MADRGIKEILLDTKTIELRVKSLGKSISQDYQDTHKPLILIALLRGSIIFMADLARAITVPVIFDFMTVSSYGDAMTNTEVKILKDLDESIQDRDIIIVEDIIDTGFTLAKILEILRSRSPRSIKICTLLDKPSRRKNHIPIDYNGFEIPDAFAVGYGLDFAQRYRNLPYIGIMDENFVKKIQGELSHE